MRKLTTLAIGTLAAQATMVVLAAPALADDGQGGVPAPTPQLADVLHSVGLAAAALAGVVLLTKGTAAYRRSQWRRRWLLRRSTDAMFVSSVGWPAGGISGRSIARSATTL